MNKPPVTDSTMIAGMMLGGAVGAPVAGLLISAGVITTQRTNLLVAIGCMVCGALLAVLWRSWLADKIYWWRFDRETRRGRLVRR